MDVPHKLTVSENGAYLLFEFTCTTFNEFSHREISPFTQLGEVKIKVRVYLKL